MAATPSTSKMGTTENKKTFKKSVILNPVQFIMNRETNNKYLLKQQFEYNTMDKAKSFYRRDLFGHYGCVNAIEFTTNGRYLLSGGDDRRVLLWEVDKALHGKDYPISMKTQHSSNIFCLGYDSTLNKLFSAGNDDQVIVHDTKTGVSLHHFPHDQPVYGLSIDPLNDNVFASACDDGRVLIFDIREHRGGNNDNICLASFSSAFHGVMFNPIESRLIATANSKEGVGLWDVRAPKKEITRYGGAAPQSCMSVRFNKNGTQILALRRRLPPALYYTHSYKTYAQFDHPGYYNSCTMKSCSFAGSNDEYILSGSDDFKLYMWKIPNTSKPGRWVPSAHMILKGHRSIVNQVRYNESHNLIASSGVEKIIKFWSPFRIPDSEEEDTSLEAARKVYSHEEYIHLVLQSGQFMSHDYSHQSTQEDPRMMAFFDSLVQREIEGWESENGVETDDGVPSSDSSSESGLTFMNTSFRDIVDTLITNTNHTANSTTDNSDNESNTTQSITTQSSRRNGETSRIEEESNRINELIAKKRTQLVRLAKAKANLEKKYESESNGESSSNSSSTTTTTSTTTSTSSSSGSDNNQTACENKKKALKKINGYLMNGLRKRILTESSSSDSDDQVNNKRPRKRLKFNHNESNSDSDDNSVPNNNKSSVNSSSSDDEVVINNKTKNNRTPDSGIDINNQSIPSSSSSSKVTFKKFNTLKNNKRMYKNRVTSSESDDDSD